MSETKDTVPETTKFISTPSIVDIQQLIAKQCGSDITSSSLDIESKNDDHKSESKSKPKTIKDIKTKYKYPLEITYHKHLYIIFHTTNMSKDDIKRMKEYIESYHTLLDDHKEVIYDRYGWKPGKSSRISIDLKSDIIVFVTANDNPKEIMGNLILINCQNEYKNDVNFKGKFVYEMAMCVLPKYQRKHLATDLIHLCWDMLSNKENNETWIYVLNSLKSGSFFRNFIQWYPHVKFKLVRP